MVRLFTSTIGRKFIMAVSGAALFLFVIGHMVGNLQFFLGPEAINRYGHFLQSNLEIIWPARIGLLVMVLLHVWSATSLSHENKAARPVPYADWQPNTASYASRTMLMSGLIIAAFIIYHLLHYTVMLQQINMTSPPQDFHKLMDGEGRHDIYTMMVIGFSRPLVSLFYIIAIGLLCLHLSHGVAAMFSSLGLKNPVYAPWIERGARVVAFVLFLGYAAIPVSILLAHCGGGCCK